MLANLAMVYDCLQQSSSNRYAIIECVSTSRSLAVPRLSANSPYTEVHVDSCNISHARGQLADYGTGDYLQEAFSLGELRWVSCGFMQ